MKTIAVQEAMEVEIKNGAPETFAETTDSPNDGASWGDDDNIVFASNSSKGMERVSASGGASQFITTVDTNRGESSHRWPVVLPGSKVLVYAVGKDGREEGPEIVLQRLDTGEKRVLIPGGTFPNFVPTGHLVYMREGTLMAVPFDVRRLEVTGVPVPVEEHVRQSGDGAMQFGLSRFGSLVYVPSDGGGTRADNETLVWVDRKGKAEPIGAPPRVYMAPKLSPDGQTLAVDITGDVKEDTWLYSFSRHALTRLTFGSGNNRFPVWTPDGKRVLLFSSRTHVPQIFWKPSDGSGAEEQISNNQYATRQGTASPDGTMVFYSENNPQSGRDIGSVELSGNHKSRLFLQTPFNETAPAISPDGRWLAYVSNESGRNEVYVRPFPGPGPKWQISTDGGQEPVWAHSGKELFYTNGDKMLAAPITARRSSPQAFVAGPPQVLFEGHYEHTPAPWPDFDVSSDDQRFLMIREETATRINVVLNLFQELRQEPPVN